MPGVLVDGAKNELLDERLAAPPFTTLEFGLFVGATIPDHATVIGDLTEQSGVGYARVAIVGWSPASLTGDFHALATANPVGFTNGDVVDWTETTGWFWFDTAGTKLIAAGRFAIPFTLPPAQTYTTTPYDTLTGE